MYFAAQILKIFKLNNLSIKFHQFCILFLLIIFINIINPVKTRLSREDTEPEIVAPGIFELINNNYNDENNKNIFYIKNFDEYIVEMKFLFLNLNKEETLIDTLPGGIKFFTYISPIIEFIFSLKLIKNENYGTEYDGVSIVSNYNKNSGNTNFQLKKFYGNITIKYIEFQKLINNTYKYSYGETMNIFIDIDNNRYPEKITKFLNDNKKQLEIFLFESFDKYLRNITNHYPKADGILLYETIVKYIDDSKSFPIPNSEYQIVFNKFKEENIVFTNYYILFLNINIDFYLVFDPNYSDYLPKKNYKVVLNITCQRTYFNIPSYYISEEKIYLNKVLEKIFADIINYYEGR